MAFSKPRRSKGWPNWDHQCTQVVWRTGKRCKNPSVLGLDRCRKHGGQARYSQFKGWRRYLLWVLLPDTIRQTTPLHPVTDEMVEIVCNVLAQSILTETVHATAALKIAAAQHLFDALSVDVHPDPASLLAFLDRDDATRVIRVLRANRLIK